MIQSVNVKNIHIANDAPFVLFGGMNVLESRDLAMQICEHYVNVTEKLGIDFVFKASFDKANRSSIHSFRGPGLDEGLCLLSDIKQQFSVPILTDVHEPQQVKPVSEVADILQLPAFLARQTDLVVAMAKTEATIHIKKPQFLAAHEMQHIINKFTDNDHHKLLLCERGSCFGYNNLVVDMLAMDQMKQYAPVTFDATHALQIPGGQPEAADGRRDQAFSLARAGMAVGIAGLFIEAHPDPEDAKCDGPSALALHQLESYLQQMQAIDALVKSF